MTQPTIDLTAEQVERERGLFEAWLRPIYGTVPNFENGGYKYADCDAWWKVWFARAALVDAPVAQEKKVCNYCKQSGHTWEDHADALYAAPPSPPVEGVVVPVEPTEAMIDAGMNTSTLGLASVIRIYKAMIATATSESTGDNK